MNYITYLLVHTSHFGHHTHKPGVIMYFLVGIGLIIFAFILRKNGINNLLRSAVLFLFGGTSILSGIFSLLNVNGSNLIGFLTGVGFILLAFIFKKDDDSFIKNLFISIALFLFGLAIIIISIYTLIFKF